MPESLPVHVNRQELHGLEVPAEFVTDDSFTIHLRNHGEATHVHLHLDEALSSTASIDATNHYVEGGGERYVSVSVHGNDRVRGTLKVVCAHGATTRYVTVIIEEPDTSSGPVEVDESLSKPKPRPRESPSLLREESLPIVALAIAALAVALVLAIAFGNALVGAAVVAVGVVAAAVVLLR